MRSIEEIRDWSGGEWLVRANTSAIEELVIDTRKAATPEKAIFIALATTRRDGHDFISAAYEKGIRNFLVHKAIPTAPYPGSSFILVNNTLAALQQLALKCRKQYDIQVVGITGSNGKTVVKEWLYQLLNEQYHIVRSPRSYNSQIGVPMSVWLMQPKHELALFEAGISRPGEMELLEKIIQPLTGIFTNIGEAHSEGFLNLRQKINEKLTLFRHVRHLIYCSDHTEINECILQYRNQLLPDQKEGQQLFTWSRKQGASLRILHEQRETQRTIIDAIYQEQTIRITIPYTDPASVENAIHCWCYLLLINTDHDVIAHRMTLLQPIAMRLELRQGINDSTIINDVYNSDLTSLLIALEFLEQQKQHTLRTVILSDMLEMGKSDAILYEQVADLIARKHIQRFIGVGSALYKHKQFFRKQKKLRSFFFKSTEDLLKQFHLISFGQEAILLKGARRFRFEKVNLLLEQKVHQTVLSIDLAALTHNLNVFRSNLKKGVRTMAMVKAFSYGSGSFEIAYLLQYSGVDYLTVAYTDEGVALRKAGITMPIMVMSPDVSSFNRMIAWKLEPEIFSLRALQAFLDMAVTLQVKHYPVHIKLDTGMHRLGFSETELDMLITLLRTHEQLSVASIFSHLAASEDPSLDFFTEEQAACFERMSSKLVQEVAGKPLRHLCNSAAIARHPGLHYDMVRLGIGLYGIDGSGMLQEKLRQISTLKTTIAQIRELPPDATIGYGRKGYTGQLSRIATICIGYADGYPRALGNGKGYVLLHGEKAPLVGVVCMDMCMIDVTHITEAQEGDEVTVFGSELPVTQLAAWAGTISYEIMTGISQRVKRVYVNEA